MRTYYNIGTTELSSRQSRVMVSAHGSCDCAVSLPDVQRKAYLNAISDAHRRRTGIMNSSPTFSVTDITARYL